ncbi:MAG: AMP-binding protein, partial [bacterium]|nr:AMP-binding protein [bacterium]
PFDLAEPPLIRVGIAETTAGKNMLLCDMHHIISDGMSVEILEREYRALYNGEALPELGLRYRDFASWQDGERYRAVIKRQEVYWQEQFADEMPNLELPLDYRRPTQQNFDGANIGFYAGREVTTSLRAIAAENNVTLYMLLLTLFNIFLARISGSEDIVVGTPTDGRSNADLENIVGMFVNTLALRNRPEGGKTTDFFLAQLKEQTVAAFENRDYPFENLVETLNVPRDTGRNPVFDVMFTLDNMEQVPGDRDVPDDKLIYRENTIAKFDMTLGCIDTGERLLFDIEYCRKLFKKETIKKFTAYFKRTLAHIVEEPREKISSIEVLSPEEKSLIIREFNNTAAQYPLDKTLHQLLEERAQSKPDSRSVLGRNLESQSPGEILLTNKELNNRAAAIASILVSKGVKPGDSVGIMIERSIQLITGILAILKAGAAYLPIAPAFPGERIRYMLEDSNAKIFLSNSGKELSKPDLTGKMTACIELPITINADTPHITPVNPVHPVHKVHQVHKVHEPVSNIRHPASSIAYIIYTSGTTGNPKGVAVPHSAAVNRLYWVKEKYRLNESDVVLQKTAVTFDVSVCELFRWLLPGATLYLLPPGEEREPGAIINAIEKQNASTVDFVPAMLEVFLEEVKESSLLNKLRTLRWVYVGAETLPAELAEKFTQTIGSRSDTRLINAYGPTEATVDVTWFDCAAAANYETVPIGKPMANTTLLVL